MTKFSFILALLSVNLVAAAFIPRGYINVKRSPLSADPAGEKNIGNGKGGQFITGQCLNNADCASGCCATLGNIGICSGLGAATESGKTGCGFVDTDTSPPPPQQPSNGNTNNDGSSTPPAAPGGLKPDPAGEKNIGNGKGGQFITGQCTNNADCASACCATLGDIGICSGPGAATESGKTGCGFSGSGSSPPPQQPTTGNTNNDSSGTPPAAPGGLKPDPAGEKNIGNGKGGQFITGQCTNNADCASACCATLGDIGICSGPGAATESGKTGCGFSGSGSSPPPQQPTTGNTNNDSSGTPPAAPGGLKPDPAGEKNIGNGKGGQFITGQCLNNADCASGCCATLGNIGICSGPGAATQSGKTGCGFSGQV